MTDTAYTINLDTESPVEAIGFAAMVTRAGSPVQNVPVVFSLEGDGTFDTMVEQKRIVEITSTDGLAFATWWEYPRYQPRRNLKSKITASCEEPGSQVNLTVWSRVQRGL